MKSSLITIESLINHHKNTIDHHHQIYQSPVPSHVCHHRPCLFHCWLARRGSDLRCVPCRRILSTLVELCHEKKSTRYMLFIKTIHILSHYIILYLSLYHITVHHIELTLILMLLYHIALSLCHHYVYIIPYIKDGSGMVSHFQGPPQNCCSLQIPVTKHRRQ